MSSAGFRRRHHEFDDEDEIEAKRRRGPPEYNEIERKIQELIARVGEKTGTSSLESNLEGLCNVLETDLERYRAKILDVISTCVVLLPEKLTVYSTLVGLLNAKNFNFGGDIVEKMVHDLHEKLEENNFEHAIHIILFLCDLGNCKVLTLSSVADFLDSLAQISAEEDVPQVRSDWFIYAVLHALPWIGPELHEKKPDDLVRIMERCQNYLESRNKPYLATLRVWLSGTPHEQEDYLDSLFAQLKQLDAAGWKETHIRRPYVAFDAALQDALHHNLPSFTPPVHKETSLYPLPSIVFRLFDYADCNTDDGAVLPGARSIERFLIEEELTWIMKSYFNDRRLCAEELLSRSKIYNVPIIHMIIEVAFGEMFRLPISDQPIIFYGSVLIEMCKLRPNNVPPVLAQAAELLYQRVPGMQPNCVDRLVDWFSFHLSNFEYRWTWEDWNDCVKDDQWNPKFIFVREVLEKCMRLSYYERVLELVPKDFEKVLPPKPDIRYLLDDDTDPNFEKARLFTTLFQDRANDEAMMAEIRGPDENFSPESFSVFFAVLLNLASKSYSHNFAALTKYHRTLKEIADVSDDMQEVILKTLYSSWKTNHQLVVILVDKLLKMQILDCGVVVNWIFSDDMKYELDRQWVWEVLNNALQKLSRHIGKIAKESGLLEQSVKRYREEHPDDDMDHKTRDETELEEQREKLNQLKDFQKNLFLDVLHKFTVVLSEHIESCESEGIEIRTPYYIWMSGRFKQIFLMHNNDLKDYISFLANQLFQEDIVGAHVHEFFQQFVSLSQ